LAFKGDVVLKKKSSGKDKKPSSKKDDKKPADKPAAKPLPKIKDGFLPGLDTLNVLAKALAKKHKEETKTRRLQAPVAEANPTLVNSASGVDLTAQTNTGLSAVTSNEFNGEGQSELSGNLLKVFSGLALALLVFLN